LQLDDPSFDELFDIVIPAVAKRNTDVPEVILSERSSITLGYSAKGNAFEDLKFIKVTSQSTRIIVLDTCLLSGRQTTTE
jgi:hypothetical protein